MRKTLAFSTVVLVGALAVLFLTPSCCGNPERAYERVLRANLHALRDVISQYHGDRGRYPESLDDLITAGYLRRVPIDPYTKSQATWRLTLENRPETEGRPGIVDVHSGARGTSRDGRPLGSL
ncbi:MAG TPA: type II secretion system protein G [Thermoanaerobaculia bacterium]|nr:type II secretion system protein G [Thermoanaerobaculia bacterium]